MVHSLNFCSFALCAVPQHQERLDLPSDSVLVAVPGVKDGSIIVMNLPGENRVTTIPSPQDTKTGMLMAVALHDLSKGGGFAVLAGYESGHAAVWTQDPGTSIWRIIYMEKAHSQPVMSLGVAHGMSAFFTSSADAVLACHSIHDGMMEMLTTQTKHAGQQSLQVRSDERILATAGWDGRVRVYSTKTLKELAVLKWHKEGCYAVGFAKLETEHRTPDETDSSSRRNMTMSERRVATAKAKHWLAAGSKDGKVSLWDIY